MIEFYVFHDGRAIAWWNHKNLMTAFHWSLVGCIPMLLIALWFKIYGLLLILLLPTILLFFSYFVFVFVRYDTNVFLKGTRVKHKFRLQDGHLFKDKKEVKGLSLYTYKNHLLLETSNSYFYIPNDGYTIGNREQFLQQIEYVRGHKIVFKSGF